MSKIKDKFEVCKTKVKATGKKVRDYVEENPEIVGYGALVGVIGAFLGFSYKTTKRQNQELVDGLLAKDHVSIEGYVDKRKGGINHFVQKDD